MAYVNHLYAFERHLPDRILWDAVTRHRRPCPALTLARQAGTRFTYPGGMRGWVEVCYYGWKTMFVTCIVSFGNCENATLDLVLILDQSSSLISGQPNYDNWNDKMLGFAASVVRAVPVSPDQTQIGLMKFSDEADVVFHLDNYTDARSILEALRGLDIDGGDTNIAGAQFGNSEWLALKSSLKIFDPKFVIKYCPISKIEGDILRTERKQFSMMTSTPVTHYLFCYNLATLSVNRSTITKSCDDFDVARLTVRGQQCVYVNVTWRDWDQSRAGILV